MRIVVTGGAGFIGSHLVDAFLAAGHDVLVIDNLWPHGGGRRANVAPGVRFAEMDIRDASVGDAVAAFKPDIVSHHAAQHSVAYGTREPRYDADVNVMGTLNLLDAAVAAGVRKFIFASSAATYGDIERLPVDETTPQAPLSPYGITKMIVEHYLRFYAAHHGLDYTILRYANVYGPRQDPNGEAGVISIFAAQFLSGQGVRVDSDGEQTRDFVFVSDVAAANVAALTRGSRSAYVVGTGRPTSIKDLHRGFAAATGFTAPLTFAPPRPADIRAMYFDPSKAERELEWRARVPLDDGIRATIEALRTAAAATS